MGDEIRNDTEFLSPHWMEEGFPARRAALYSQWQAAHKAGLADPLHAVVGLAGTYLAALNGEVEDLPVAHLQLARALGLSPEDREDLTVEQDDETTLLQGDRELVVPVVVSARSASGRSLVVLDARPVETLDDLVADTGDLTRPLLREDASGAKQEVPAPAAALSEVFVAEDAPRYVLVMAGRWMLLTDAPRWSEGRWLGVDILAVLERRELTSQGGLATMCALLGGDVLLPDRDGSIGMDRLSAESTSHAVGVSEDLRDGLKRSIEILAGDVVRIRRERGLDLDDPELPQRLARECLRFLYRILFLLFAEARPELGIVPVGAPEYAAGYGLDRLRDLTEDPLTTTEEREGTHFHDSLDVLFRLVSGDLQDVDSMPVEALRADLFDRRRTALIDGEPGEADPPRLHNEAVRNVLRLLLLSRPAKGRRRGWISYANLGINQLGAVYEGLMSYTGVLTGEPMVEVAKGGDPSKGSWLVPQSREGDFDEGDLVRSPDPETGELRIRRYRAGEFAFRLSGRDRERSASFYTPEVLTHLVVEHSLAELFTEDTTAEDVLEARVCEPALGSGAFANEAVNQLADAYLERRQRELDERIPADRLPVERRRVKAWIALHRVYGVDLNATAVELAEVSMWLNVMQPHLAAPWFGLHLRRGNSLIGARRAVYDLAALRRDKAKWWSVPPQDRKLSETAPESLAPGLIHHFLLPAETWGAVSGAEQARELAPDEVARMKTWRRSVHRQPTATQSKTLAMLARRVERLWGIALRRLEISEREASRDIAIWGREAAHGGSTVTRERIEDALADPDSMYQRLRLVMDAWCALSFWPLDAVEQAPDWEAWLATLTDVLGIEVKDKGLDRDFLSIGDDFDELATIERYERAFHRMPTMLQVLASHPWLSVVRDIASHQGFFHWELDFAQVFARGGFDLQVGNPPWVRPDWKDSATLAESDPWFLLTEKIPEKEFRTRRAQVLADPSVRHRYLSDLAEGSSTADILGNSVEHPVLGRIRTNLYMNFMERTWRSMSGSGVVGLLHPEGHLVDPKAGVLRENTYRRLRRHWQFINELQLFPEVAHTSHFAVHIYGVPQSVEFLQAVGLLSVETLSGSLADVTGLGEEPGIQFVSGGWDTRPHRSRILAVDGQVLSVWAALVDPPGTPSSRARVMRPYLKEHQEVLEEMARQKERLGETGVRISMGWNEKTAKQDGFIEQVKTEPRAWNEVILQGPHFNICDPFFKNARESGFVKSDYDPWDLEELPEDAIPRTNYRRACSRDRYDSGIDHWEGLPSWDYWRVAVRRMTQSGLVRSVVPALVPRGAAHVDAVHCCTASTCAAPVHARKSPDGDFRTYSPEPEDALATLLVCGVFSSLPLDYLVKVSGKTDLHPEVLKSLPAPIRHPAWPLLLLRTLRLNCLTNAFAPLWEALAPLTVADDSWTPAFDQWPALTAPTGGWTWDTPLRSDFERRAALVETDALGAIMLGLSAEQLCLVYRAQFAVLRKYENDLWFDCAGHQIARDHHAFGIHQRKTDFSTLLDYVAAMEAAGRNPQRDLPPGDIAGDPRFEDLLTRYEAPFVKADREREMTLAHAEFTRRLQAVGLLLPDGSVAPDAEDVDAQAVLEGRLAFPRASGDPR